MHQCFLIYPVFCNPATTCGTAVTTADPLSSLLSGSNVRHTRRERRGHHHERLAYHDKRRQPARRRHGQGHRRGQRRRLPDPHHEALPRRHRLPEPPVPRHLRGHREDDRQVPRHQVGQHHVQVLLQQRQAWLCHQLPLRARENHDQVGALRDGLHGRPRGHPPVQGVRRVERHADHQERPVANHRHHPGRLRRLGASPATTAATSAPP